MVPQADGRTYACEYCRASVQVAVDGHQIAAAMRADLSNIDAFLMHLARTLSTGFAERSTIHADAHFVHAIEVNLDPDVFLVHREPSGVVTRHRRMSRGIALRTETLAAELWVQKLTDALARHANANARAAWVLSQIRGS